MSTTEPIAITGMSVMFPGAPDLDSYWCNLVEGVDSIGDVPQDRLDPGFHGADPDGPLPPDRTYCTRGGFLPGPVEVDAGAFGIMPSSVAGMEPDQLIALRVAAAAVEDAGGAERLGDRDRVGVVLGRGGYLSPGLLRFDQRVRVVRQVLGVLDELKPSLGDAERERLRDALLEPLGQVQPESTIGLVPNLAASRLANRLDLRGTAYTVDAACASSLIAIDHAVSELAARRCDAVLAGGVHHCHDDTLWSVFTQLRALSPTQHIRPLSREADGLLIGEGTGIVVLKRLADARRDGDRVYAVIRGVGTSSDGRSSSLFNPDSGGQQLALRRAWEAAGLDPAEPGSVGLLEAHGTATRAGDEAEIRTLAEVFGPAESSGDGPAVIGSVKSMIGHTLPAAGVAGLVKAALAVYHATLLPTLHCSDPNPLLETTRFRPIQAAQPWEGPRRAAVNAFGFGGINAHVVLEEAGDKAPAARPVVAEPDHFVRLAASSRDELVARLDQPLRELIAAEPGTGPCRIGVADPTERRLDTARKIVARAGESWRGRNDIWFTTRPLLSDPAAKTAFVFPGLEAEFDPHCDDVAAHFGLGTPPVGEQDVTDRAATASSVGRLLDAVLRRIGVRPDALAGHSVGEWTAMVAGGMQPAMDEGAALDRFWPGGFTVPEVDFVALGCSAEEATERIAGHHDLVISHDNAPKQSIVCGSPDAAALLAGECRADGVFAKILPFRSGFHTPMFGDYLAPFERLLGELELREPEVPIWSATTAAPYPVDAADVRSLYLDHLVRPVRFREMTEQMYAAGFRVFVQLGPGSLASFIADTLGTEPHLVISANSGLRSGMAQLRRVATALWVEGDAVDFSALDKRKPRGGIAVSTAAPALSVASGARGMFDRGGPKPASSTGIPEYDALLTETQAAVDAVVAAASRPAARPVTQTSTLDVSTAAMPYLKSHRFFRQREGWPDEADFRPVVPATTLVELARAEAERAWPDAMVTAVHDARFNRWLIAEPARQVDVEMRRNPDRTVEVRLGEYASMTLQLGRQYPDPPAEIAAEAGTEPPHSAEDTYRLRKMFHGPEFQGITGISSIGPGHITGEITVPSAPGALLDNAGQLLGVWMMAREQDKLLAFPARMGKIEFFGPHPPPHARLRCHARVRIPSPPILEMDAQLVYKGEVWARITGWQDIRLDCDEQAHQVYSFPQDNMLATAQPGGFTLVADRWPGVATRDIYAGIYLNSAERTEYDRYPARKQRHWLLGRIAAKDAVRNWLAERGVRSVFPAEVQISNDEHGAPQVRGCHRTLPELAVSLAHSGDLAVAMACGEPHTPTGIDVQEVTSPSAGLETALSDAERHMLPRLADGDLPLWFTRFWAAKEAVAKALGTGLRGHPQDFEVLAMDATGATVASAAGAFVIEHRQVADAADRRYVVAWTAGEQQNRTAGTNTGERAQP